MNIPDYLHGIAQETLGHECEGARMRRCWAVVLGLEIKQDGNQFCILWGENLQIGVAGFGSTPADAIAAFETAMYEKAMAPKRRPTDDEKAQSCADAFKPFSELSKVIEATDEHPAVFKDASGKLVSPQPRANPTKEPTKLNTSTESGITPSNEDIYLFYRQATNSSVPFKEFKSYIAERTAPPEDQR